MEWSALYPPDHQPSPEEIAAAVGTPLWGRLRGYIEETYGLLPRVEHSCCTMARGWNVKYKKSGRSLCTLYPAVGCFACMVVLSARAEAELELLCPTWDPYTRELYRGSPPYRDGRWLMVEVTTAEILEDLKELLRIRWKTK